MYTRIYSRVCLHKFTKIYIFIRIHVQTFNSWLLILVHQFLTFNDICARYCLKVCPCGTQIIKEKIDKYATNTNLLSSIRNFLII